jgi:4-diphosphocytidyl-2-C-methyl-D-erythritol kinase
MNSNKTIGKISTPSKINLFLRITGKRADGYHEIETIFLPLSEPADIITISKSKKDGIEILSNSDQIPLNEKNICFKAATEFAKLAEITPNWEIHIEKNIPVAAGLGGGSSDAAAVLKILNNNLKKVEDSDLKKLAANLGADVPFFLAPLPSTANGIGEKLTPININQNLHILLVNPYFPISAKWAYQQFANHKKTLTENRNNNDLKNLIAILNSSSLSQSPKYITNDLAPAVYEKFPIMETITEQMNSSGALTVGMSGSGSTIFAICESRNAVANLAEKIDSIWGDAVKIIPGRVEV